VKLSILDQAPIAPGQTAKEALDTSLSLAQLGEEYGYNRYWIAEHHDLKGLACSVPEVMLSYIGAQTSTISIGSGAILLPYYKPYKIAETFNMLQTLFPNRVDIGIGRAPGGPAEASNALTNQYLQEVWNLPQLLEDLLHFLHRNFPKDHEFANLVASPVPTQPPHVWLLGTSKKSALLAAEKGISYAFGHFMSDNDGESIILEYKKAFKKSFAHQKPYVILTISAICAETDEKANEIASGSLLLTLLRSEGVVIEECTSLEQLNAYPTSIKQKEKMEEMKKKMIIGTPKKVREQLQKYLNEFQADELMIITNTLHPEDRMNSYRLISEECITI